MQTLLNLKELAVRLDKVDMLLLALVKRRMDIALQVGEYKFRITKEDIFRPKIEARRLSKFRRWARTHKMSPHFAEALFYLIIGESCKQQLIQLQILLRIQQELLAGKTPAEPKTEDEEYQILKQNLLLLTKVWSQSYDKKYDKAFFATHAYLEFESNLIKQEVARLQDTSVALDLGCATGRLTLGLADRFNQVVGYDISPDMIERAGTKKQGAKSSNVTFKVADIENSIPEQDNSASFVIMNLGTASDIRNIQSVLQEIKRVLKPGGRFLCSFYNRDALLYRWDFIPWPTGLAAEVNLHKDCLEVHHGEDIFSVYARAYTVKEVRKLFDGFLEVSNVLTYPTISSLLPHDLFKKQRGVKKAILELDRTLVESGAGAYILVAGQKMSA